jgi:hypothetical protein
MNTEFVRIVADIELRDCVFATKEAVAMRLEPLWKVRIVSVDALKNAMKGVETC